MRLLFVSRGLSGMLFVSAHKCTSAYKLRPRLCPAQTMAPTSTPLLAVLLLLLLHACEHHVHRC
jgi:hypothetical protein